MALQGAPHALARSAVAHPRAPGWVERQFSFSDHASSLSLSPTSAVRPKGPCPLARRLLLRPLHRRRDRHRLRRRRLLRRRSPRVRLHQRRRHEAPRRDEALGRRAPGAPPAGRPPNPGPAFRVSPAHWLFSPLRAPPPRPGSNFDLDSTWTPRRCLGWRSSGLTGRCTSRTRRRRAFAPRSSAARRPGRNIAFRHLSTTSDGSP